MQAWALALVLALASSSASWAGSYPASNTKIGTWQEFMVTAVCRFIPKLTTLLAT
jgi:hypothetical protein